MAINIDDLSLEEIRELSDRLSERYNDLQRQAADTQTDRRARVGAAIAQLDTLLGPTEGAPGTGNIRAVRRYDGETMAQNAHVALPLAFQGLEALTATVRDIAALAADTSAG